MTLMTDVRGTDSSDFMTVLTVLEKREKDPYRAGRRKREEKEGGREEELCAESLPSSRVNIG